MEASSARLLRSAYLLTGDRGVAEDLLQQTLLRTGGRWSAARRSPEAYARRVLVNLTRDRHRAAVRVGAVGAIVERDLRSEDHAAEVADRRAVIEALGQLSVEHRVVLVLRFYADLSVTEVAEAIGESEGTVKSRTSRALGRMRELLADPEPMERERARIEVADDDR